MKKSIAPAFRLVRQGGQVPSRDNLEAMRLAQTPAPKFNAAMLLEHTDPVMRVESIAKGLGMDVARENSWTKFLEDQLNGGTNELVMRKALYQRMLGERMDPILRKALFQRAMSYRREKLRKSMVQVVTPDEILEKAKGTPIGGITPGGNKRVAKDKYVKVGDGKSKAEESGSAKLTLTVQRQAAVYAGEGQVPVEKTYTKKVTVGEKVGERAWLVKTGGKMMRLQKSKDGTFFLFSNPAPGKVNKWMVTGDVDESKLPGSEGLSKAEARGGTYHRRVPKKKGKGYNYIYDPEKYDTRDDAHISGEDAKKARIQKAVTALVDGAEKGCAVGDMKVLAKKFGSKEVASYLKKECAEGGSMQYKGGKFKTRKLAKSLEPDFRFVLGDDQ